jgi:hypothetical protein
MNLQETITLAKDILIIFGILIGGYLSIKFYLQFAPDIIFRITPVWSEISPDFVVLKIEIENKSKVRLTKSIIRFKTISHVRSQLTNLTEWVELDDNVEEICKTTRIFYPGSILKIDRLYRCKEDEILQGIIQFEAKFSAIQKILADIRGRRESWTNTFIVAK